VLEKPVRGTFEDLVGPGTWRELLTVGALRSYRPGTLILRQGDPGGFLLALESGRVSLLASAADGAQLLLTVRGAGHLIGELAADDQQGRPANVAAIDRCTALYLPRAAFERFLKARHCEQRLADYVAGKLDQSVSRQVDLVHRSAVQRIAKLFLDLVTLAPAGLAEPNRIPFTQEELSASLGLARSTVAEQLGVLRRAGALEAGPRIVVADVGRLTQWVRA
jgi:CRP/FNR family cyclic AMP-dependent transcriptional regulator